ncbi:NADPH-dependent aldehyde reductase ARI1 [Strongylocentrotus purpuratus]|uniref:NAD-dependent epimerase/dehydratase domain-containing protein n=1 Tax=Strongylocentrotus purpuratus TaxID=7668 RepID=A0A7M7LSN5_STRPU|nr:NADPH-dependent aldehyde reductase ARI1 [Strongylocentrotus purpuratus]
MAANVERVLVTGASGYIATHIVKQLQEAGYRVRGTVRSVSNPVKVGPLKELCPNPAHELELVEADLTKDEGWKEAVQGCSHVLHTASPFPLAAPKHEDELIKPAVDGTVRVLQACQEVGGVERVVVTSSCYAISDLAETPKEPLTEENWLKVEKLGLNAAYAKSKALAERAAWDFVEKLPAESKFELAVINPSVVLGPALCGAPGTSVEIVRRMMERDPFLAAKVSFPVCDIRDVAKAHVVAMTLPEAAGNRHIIAPCTLWYLEMANALREEFGKQGYNPPTSLAPYFLLKVGSWFDSSAKTIVQIHGHKVNFSDHRLRQVLGITPYDPKVTLVDMAYSCIDRGFIVKKSAYKPRD